MITKKIFSVITTIFLSINLISCSGTEKTDYSEPTSKTDASMTSHTTIASEQSTNISSEQSENNVQEYSFTDGPNGTDHVSIKIGDTFLGWTLTEAKESDYNELEASFKGTTTLTGILSRTYYEEGPGDWVQFVVSDESKNLLPYYEFDTRGLWFGFENEQFVIDSIGKEYFEINCEIEINGYNIDFRPMMTMNTTEFVQIVRVLE